jgi:hypothetical protein
LEQVCLLASATRAFRRLDAALPPELRVIGGSTVVDVLKDGSTVVTVIDD